MLPPLLEIYVVTHPDDPGGTEVANRLIDHFHGTAFSGLIGGAVEVFVRREGWTAPGESPRPLPFVESLPYGIPEPELTVVLPVLGNTLARAVEGGGSWQTYIEQLCQGADAHPDKICIIPVRLASALSKGLLHDLVGKYQSTDLGDGMCRDISQAIAQFVQDDLDRLKVFISHTKRASSGETPDEIVGRVREVILKTKLEDFFDAQDLQPGTDWSSKLRAEASNGSLLAVRTDLYATREWCQREILTAKFAGIPIVTLDALSNGEDRGSFLMDHTPRVPLNRELEDGAILRALAQLVDECLKRALWKRQQQLAVRTGSDVAAWWAPHAPEPVTLAAWINRERASLSADGEVTVLHPDPPLGPDELETLNQLAKLSGLQNRLEILTPRGLAIRGR